MSIAAPTDWMDTDAFMDWLAERGAGRPFPDNQEIFMARGTTGEGQDRPPAIFVDLLEAAELESDDEAPFFHAKEALERDGREEEAAALAAPAAVHKHDLQHLDSDQAVAYSAAFPSANLQIGVVRLKGVATDCVISLYGTLAGVNREEPEVGSGVEKAKVPAVACPSLESMVNSVQVLDWGLFGG